MEALNGCSYYLASDKLRRYSYTAARVECLMRRGHSLRPNVFVKQRFGQLKIVLNCERRSRECKHFMENVIDQLTALDNGTEKDNGIKNKDGSTLEPTVTVVHSNCYRRSEVERNQSELILLINGKRRKITDTEFQDNNKSSRIMVTSTKDIIKNTNLLLERYVCGQLKEMVDTLIADHDDTNNCFQFPQSAKPCQDRKGLQHTSTTSTRMNDFLTSSGHLTCKKFLQSTKRKDAGFERGSLRSGKRFRPSENLEPDRHKMEVFLLDVIAMFKRSDVPQSEWPRLEYPSTEDLNHKILTRLSEIDRRILGCGYQHNILEIFLNRQENRRLDEEIIQELQMHVIYTYHFNYGPCEYIPLLGLNVGTSIGRCGRFATLGGFACFAGDLYALTARHFVEEHSGMIYSRNNADQSECIAVMPQQAQQERGELDIAAVRILPKVDIDDTRFKDSTGAPANTLLFKFEDHTDSDIQRLLQGELVFAWTANSNASPSIGRITVPLFQRPSYTYKFVVIVNENESNNDNGELFGTPGDSGAIVCSDDKDVNSVHVISMFMGQLDRRDITKFLTLPLQQGLQQINAELGINLQLC